MLYCASEAKALLPFLDAVETDVDGLKDYLAFQFCLAGKTLFVSGPPDVVDEEEIFSKPFDEQVTAKAVEQVEALKGMKGALLHTVSIEDGSKLHEMKFESCPVFDGMAAAEGKLFISMMDGSIICCE